MGPHSAARDRGRLFKRLVILAGLALAAGLLVACRPMPLPDAPSPDTALPATPVVEPPPGAPEPGPFTPRVNLSPVFQPTPDRTVKVGDRVVFTVSAIDPDDDVLSYVASPLPPGATFDPASRTCSWVPVTPGSYKLIFQVSDRQLTDSQTVTITVLPPPPPAPAVEKARFNLIFYGEHNPDTDLRIIKARPHYAIINPSHGLWGEIIGYGNCRCLVNVSDYQAVGIKVIGYITGGYEGMGSGGWIDRKWYTLEMNKKMIENMARLDHVDGIFIDECTAFPKDSSKKYLKELTDLVHSFGLLAWGNVGSDRFDPWFFTGGGFDMMHSTEEWHGQPLSQVQQQYGQRISVSGFKPAYTLQDALRLTRDAWRKGIAYAYINYADYAALAPWFDDYARLLSQE